MNPAQWQGALIGIIAVTAPALFVGVGRPWRRTGAPGARAAWIGLAVAVSLVGVAVALIGILGARDAERQTGPTLRAAQVVTNLAFDIAEQWGPNAWIAPALVIAIAWIVTLAAALAVRRFGALPESVDLAELRALARVRDVGMLRRRYATDGEAVDTATFELAVALAAADRRADGLAREVELEYRTRQEHRLLTIPRPAEYGLVLESAAVLAQAVRRSTSISEAERNVERLRALVLDLVSGREPELVGRLRAEAARVRDEDTVSAREPGRLGKRSAPRR